MRIRVFAIVAMVLVGWGWRPAASAQTPSSRIALVIGNGAYPAGNAPRAPNDAGLVAQTLAAAGFEVAGARDLDSDGIRRAFRDFLEQAARIGPDGIAFIYLAGYAVQFEGDNYYVPIDAKLARDTDVPIQALRVSDLTRALDGVLLLARVVVVDGAYKTPFAAAASLAGGLALVDPEPGTLMAFNATPGTLGSSSTGPYGVYGQAVAEMLRQGGVPVQQVFDRIRLRVNDLTRGADVPWGQSKLTRSFVFLQASPDATAPATPPMSDEALERRPIRAFPVGDAYNVAVARDSVQGYQDYLTAYPDSSYATRIRQLLAVRREALTWQRTVGVGTPDAYWSYLRRYPNGPHGFEAQRRLRALSVALVPPPEFVAIPFDVPSPSAQELDEVDVPAIIFAPDAAPLPPPSSSLLPPPQEAIYHLPPPPPSVGPGLLPIPFPIPNPAALPSVGPGRLDPMQGVRRPSAQPPPVSPNPQGGLPPRPASGANPPPASITAQPTPRVPTPPAQPLPTRPMPPVPAPGLPLPVQSGAARTPQQIQQPRQDPRQRRQIQTGQRLLLDQQRPVPQQQRRQQTDQREKEQQRQHPGRAACGHPSHVPCR